MRKSQEIVKKTNKNITKEDKPVARKRKAIREDQYLDDDEYYNQEDSRSSEYEDYDDEDYSDEESEKERVSGMSDEIEDFISCRPDLIILELCHGWAIIAKVVSLRINQIANSSGFQPFERTQDSKKCLLTVVEFGPSAGRGELAYLLKKRGCPSVRIGTRYDIEKVLNEI